MLTVRQAGKRGSTRLSWLDSRHTFSFNAYHDPAWMGFGPLRVINDDRVAGGGGFAAHGHRDMEIISYVVAGTLEHRDSLGTCSVIPAGDVQRMTAGNGIRHSEFNPSPSEPVRFLQIWIEPETRGLAPSYQQLTVPTGEKRGRARLIASRDGRDGSLTVHQDVRICATLLDAGTSVAISIPAGRAAWVQIVAGAADVNGVRLGEGDGAAIEAEPTVTIEATSSCEALIFDLPA